MNHLGKSGAEIVDQGHYVCKTGGTTDVIAQASLCKDLGKKVCPQIYGIDYNLLSRPSYSMEKLLEPSSYKTLYTIPLMFDLLKNNVWERKDRPKLNNWDFSCHLFIDFMGIETYKKRSIRLEVHRLKNTLSNLSRRNITYNKIHGDATVANAMSRNRNGSDIVIIDPVPCRDDVPPLIEIDLAGLMQSVYQWEYSIINSEDRTRYDYSGAEKRVSENTLVRMIKNNYPYLLCGTYFWSAYKCLRILNRNHDEESVNWALENYFPLLEKAEKYL